MQLWQYTNEKDLIINITASGVDVYNFVVGATLVKNDVATAQLDGTNPAEQPRVIENANYRSPDAPIVLVADPTNDTYIQAVYTVALESGAIHWHVEWEPVTDNGFLSIA